MYVTYIYKHIFNFEKPNLDGYIFIQLHHHFHLWYLSFKLSHYLQNIQISTLNTK